MRKKHQTFRTLALTLAGVVCSCRALVAVRALADNSAGVVKPFAKHGIPGAQIVFSAADFQTNQIGGGKLAGILITACPEAAEGTFQISGVFRSAQTDGRALLCAGRRDGDVGAAGF